MDRKMQVLGRTVTALPGESLSASTLLSSVPALGGKRTKDEKTPEIKKTFSLRLPLFSYGSADEGGDERSQRRSSTGD